MEYVTSEEYEELGAEFQYEIIKMLNEVLKKHKITEEARKEICGDFIFNFSMLLDQGEIQDTLPSVVFIKEDKVLFKNEEFEYHDYAFGNTDEVFSTDHK
jgi:hypothetical protein